MRRAPHPLHLPQQLGKLEEAEELFTAALDIRERVLGSVHLDTAASLSDMTMLQVDQGRLLEAEPLFRRWVQRCVHVVHVAFWRACIRGLCP